VSQWSVSVPGFLPDAYAFQQAIEAATVAFAGGKSIRNAQRRGHDPKFSRRSCLRAHAVCALDMAASVIIGAKNTDDADIVTGAQVFVDACRRLRRDEALWLRHCVGPPLTLLASVHLLTLVSLDLV